MRLYELPVVPKPKKSQHLIERYTHREGTVLCQCGYLAPSEEAFKNHRKEMEPNLTRKK